MLAGLVKRTLVTVGERRREANQGAKRRNHRLGRARQHQQLARHCEGGVLPAVPARLDHWEELLGTLCYVALRVKESHGQTCE